MPAAQPFSQLPDGSHILIDANIFVYHFTGTSRFSLDSTALLERVEQGLLEGVTTVTILAETLHRLMMIEAVAKLGISTKNIVRYVKEHLQEAATLTDHLRVPGEIRRLGVKVVEVTVDDIERSRSYKTAYGLLTNDAITCQVMQRLSLVNLATNDPDFTRVPQMSVFAPFPAPVPPPEEGPNASSVESSVVK